MLTLSQARKVLDWIEDEHSGWGVFIDIPNIGKYHPLLEYLRKHSLVVHHVSRKWEGKTGYDLLIEDYEGIDD